MKRKISNLLILCGSLCILSALVLFWNNQQEASRARERSRHLMPQLTAQIAAKSRQTRQPEQTEPITEQQMETVTLEGDGYIGYLTIPSLGIEEPVLSDWSESKLKIAPCRYTGSVGHGDLVLMGHNYAYGFGQLDQLQPGDAVYFTDTAAVVRTYRVEEVEMLSADAVDQMVDSGYDLTLFTCTYSGQSRWTVRCQQDLG